MQCGRQCIAREGEEGKGMSLVDQHEATFRVTDTFEHEILQLTFVLAYNTYAGLSWSKAGNSEAGRPRQITMRSTLLCI